MPQVRTRQVRTRQVRMPQVRTRQVRTRQVRIRQVRMPQFPATMGFRGGRSLLCLAGGALVLVPLACVVAAVALFVVRWRWDFARGIQAGLIVAPFAVWIIYGPNLVLYALVILLLGVGLRAYLADRALRRAGIEKHQLD